MSIYTRFMIRILLVLLFFVVNSLTLVSSFSTCPKCGDMEVPFPLSTSSNCGDPNYRIYCNNGELQFMSAQGFYYDIISIDSSASKLVIRPPLMQKNTCYSSDLASGGLLLDEKLPFNISTHNTVMLLNCSENILLSPLNCSSNSFCRQFEDADEGSGCRGTICCHYFKDSSMNSHKIRVRLGGCTAYTCVVALKPGEPSDSWKFGVEIQWLPLN